MGIKEADIALVIRYELKKRSTRKNGSQFSFSFSFFLCVRGGKRVPILSRSATPAVKEGSDSRGEKKQKNKKTFDFFWGELC